MSGGGGGFSNDGLIGQTGLRHRLYRAIARIMPASR